MDTTFFFNISVFHWIPCWRNCFSQTCSCFLPFFLLRVHQGGEGRPFCLSENLCRLYSSLQSPTSAFSLKHVVTFQVSRALWNNMLKCMNFAGSKGRVVVDMCVEVGGVVFFLGDSSHLQYVHKTGTTEEFGVWKMPGTWLGLCRLTFLCLWSSLQQGRQGRHERKKNN